MIGTKVKVPQNALVLKYSKDYDILDVFIEKVVPSFSDEVSYGIYEYFDTKTEQLVGVSIMDYTKRDKDSLRAVLPFDIDFDYVDKKVGI